MENNKRLTFKNLFFAGLLGFTIAVCVCIPITKSIKMSSEPEPKITINIATMKSSLTDVASLATEEYNFKNVAIFSKDKAKLLFISIPFTDKSIIMTYEGLVKAGIKDCSQINIAANDSTKQITITCPNIEVFDDPIIYTDSIKFYDYSNNIFSPITPEDIVDFESSEESVAKQQAIDNGILDKAKDSAYNLLYNQAIAFINGTEYNDYQVYIKFV